MLSTQACSCVVRCSLESVTLVAHKCCPLNGAEADAACREKGIETIKTVSIKTNELERALQISAMRRKRSKSARAHCLPAFGGAIFSLLYTM